MHHHSSRPHTNPTTRAITAPLDTVKIRLQLQTVRVPIKHRSINIVKSILRREGLLGLWKGNVPAEILYIMYGAVQFSSFAACSNAIALLERDHSFTLNPQLHSLFAGLGAGIVGTAVTYPFDYLRTRLAANPNREPLSMRTVYLHIVRSEGLRGIYAGFPPTLLSVAAASSLMFWSYDVARKFAKQFDLAFLDVLCGFVAGAVSKCLTFPLDTLRKRAQMYTAMHPGDRRTSSYRLLRGIVQREGVWALYRGFAISILKTAPTSAIALSTYEYTLDVMRGLQRSSEILK